MEKWFVPAHMKKLANSTVNQFGYDHSGTVEYQFNQYGFRNKYTNGTSINIIGNSISFDIGLPQEQTFGHLLSQKIGLPCNNFSFGCYSHENHDYLVNIKALVEQNTNDVFIVQINNLDRLRVGNSVHKNIDPAIARERFLDYFEQLSALLAEQKAILMYWDDCNYNLPENVIKQISIVNKFCLDRSIEQNPDTFGARSHSVIAKTLTSLYLSKFN